MHANIDTAGFETKIMLDGHDCAKRSSSMTLHSLSFHLEATLETYDSGNLCLMRILKHCQLTIFGIRLWLPSRLRPSQPQHDELFLSRICNSEASQSTVNRRSTGEQHV